MSETHIFTVGGTVQASDGLYISRRADNELLALCRGGNFAYVLTPRQLGKSSLMVRTAEQLTKEGARSVIIDLSQIGVQVTAEEWYVGLLSMIEEQLDLDTDAANWWQQRAHLGMTQKLTKFFEEVLLKEINAPVVIFVDEIDTTLSLGFTDDFFAAIRYFYNARSISEDVRRLSFVLIGVATPGDLIRDPQRTPFNIGQRVDLTDFTLEEALPLAAGLGLADQAARQVLGWVLKWTGGHPYLTQRLCRALTDQGRKNWSEADIDAVVSKTFFGKISEEDNNLQFVRDMLTKRAPDLSEVLYTYREVLRDKRPVRDEEQSLIKSHLKLSGVAQRRNGELNVRNPIYAQVFNDSWVKEHLPVNWTKRLTRVAIGLVLTLMVLSVPTSIWAFVAQRRAVADRDEANRQKLIAVAAQREAVNQRDQADKLRALAEQQSKIAKQQTTVAVAERAKAETARQDTDRQRLLAVAAANQEKLARQSEGVQRQKAEAAARRAEALAKSESAARLQAVELGRQAEAARIEAEKQAALARTAEQEAKRLRDEAQDQKKTTEQERDTARGQNQISVARQLADQGKQLLLSGNGPAAASYLVRALTLDDRPELRQTLLEAEAKSAPHVWEQPMTETTASPFPETEAQFKWAGSGRGSYGRNLTFSPNRKELAWAGSDGTVMLMNTETGSQIRSLPHRPKPRALVYSSNGKQLAAQNQDHTIDIWNAETGDSLGSLKNEVPGTLVAFDPDKKRLIQLTRTVSASDHLTIRVVSLDMQTGNETNIDLDPAAANSFSNDWTKLGVGHPDGSIAIVDVETGGILTTLRGHTSRIDDLSFTTNGQKLASRSGNEIRLWDLAKGSGIEIRHFDKDSRGDLVFSSDGSRLATIGNEGFKVWEFESGRELRTIFANNLNSVSRILLSPGGTQLAAQDSDGTVRVWDVDTGELYCSLYSKGPILDFSNQGIRLYSLSDSRVQAWNVKTSEAGKIIPGHPGGIASLVFSPDGQFLATSGVDKLIKIWNLETGKEIGSFTGEKKLVVVQAFDPQRQRLSTYEDGSSQDYDVLFKLWDTQTGKEVTSIPITDPPFLLSPDWRILAIGGRKGPTRIRNVETGQDFPLGVISTAGFDAWAFSRDGDEFAQGDNDGTIKLWDTAKGNTRLTLKAQNRVDKLYFSSDKRRLASVTGETIEIWDITDGKGISKISKIAGAVNSGAFSPDGRRFAAVVGRAGIKIWDVNTGGLERTLTSSDPFANFVFSPDGKWIVSRGSEARLWNLEAKNSKGFVLPGGGGSNAVLSRDGRWLAYGDRGHRVRLWEFEAVKNAGALDHWALLRKVESEVPRKLKALELEILPQLQVRDILGDKYNPSYELAAAEEVSVDEKDKEAEARENKYQSEPSYMATITGTIDFNGPPPTPKPIDTAADPVCTLENPNLTTEDWIVTGGKLANVFVYVKSGTRLDNYIFDAPTSEVVIERKGCQTIPHLVGVQTHQVLTLVNNDKTTHNFHFTPKHNPDWNQSLPQGASPLYHEFALKDPFIPLKCNQHPWEKSYVGVFSNPFFAISAKDGSYTISGLPPGHYTIVAWHERGVSGVERSVEITVGPSENRTLNFTFTDKP